VPRYRDESEVPRHSAPTLSHQPRTPSVTAWGAAALEILAPIAPLLTRWRHSAEVYADPALHATLTRDPDGPVSGFPEPLRPCP
jgi:hypothetical protein